jgi:23S rRNA pseudouridine1911/1915/1917 synthase
MSRQALHAHRLELKHPVSGSDLSFNAPLPPDMENFLQTHGYFLPKKN